MFYHFSNLEHPLSNKIHRLSHRSFRNFTFVISRKKAPFPNKCLTIPHSGSSSQSDGRPTVCRFLSSESTTRMSPFWRKRKAHLLQYVCFISYHNNEKQERDRNNHYLLVSIRTELGSRVFVWVCTIHPSDKMLVPNSTLSLIDTPPSEANKNDKQGRLSFCCCSKFSFLLSQTLLLSVENIPPRRIYSRPARSWP